MALKYKKNIGNLKEVHINNKSLWQFIFDSDCSNIFLGIFLNFWVVIMLGLGNSKMPDDDGMFNLFVSILLISSFLIKLQI